MTTYKDLPNRSRDIQDGIERHIYSEIEDVDGGGRIIKVKGNGTEDEEAIFMNIGGIGMRFPKDTNAEVHLLSGGSDTCLKFAIVCIPHDKEHKWKENHSGLQYWNDSKRRLQWGPERAHLTDENAAIGKNGNVEVKGNDVYIRGNIYFENPPTIGTPAFTPEDDA